jgi:hypothetical protein
MNRAIGSFNEFQQIFGGLWEQSSLPSALEQFFEHGGRNAVVVRVVSAAGLPPSTCRRRWHLLLAGLCPGRNEHLRASVDYDGIGQQDEDLFNLVVQRVQRAVRSWSNRRKSSAASPSCRDPRGKSAASCRPRAWPASPALATAAAGHHAGRRSSCPDRVRRLQR